MTIPTYLECIQPILELVSDEKKHSNKQAIEFVTDYFKLTGEEKSRLIPSGGRCLIDDRVMWALLYIRKGNFVEYTERGMFKITLTGKTLLLNLEAKNLFPLTLKLLRDESKALNDWYMSNRSRSIPGQSMNAEGLEVLESTYESSEDDEIEEDTPSERIAKAYGELKQKTIDELVDKMRGLDDKAFEIFIANLLPKIGYGKEPNDIIRANGGKGDGGIDGIVQLDSLGAQKIYIQAKHWKKEVGMKPVAEFIDKVNETRVSAGIFVALSGFNKETKEHIHKRSHNIAWVDAYTLAEIMIRNGVGVILDRVYQTYRIDDEYFEINSV